MNADLYRKTYDRFKTPEAKQLVEIVRDLSELCYEYGLDNHYPAKHVYDIINILAIDAEGSANEIKRLRKELNRLMDEKEVLEIEDRINKANPIILTF